MKRTTDQLNELFADELKSKGLKPMPCPRLQNRTINSYRTAGLAYTPRNECVYNLEMVKLNFREFMKWTPPHEVCHCFDRYMKSKTTAHGEGWQRLMVAIGLQARTTHTYKVPTQEGATLFKCNCRENIFIGKVRTRKAVSGASSYFCRNCKARLTKMDD